MDRTLATTLRPLNDRQRRFVSEYVTDWNGTQAAIRAGYAPRSADVTAARLLRKASVQAAVQQELRAAERRNHVSKDRVLAELMRIAFADLRDIAPWNEHGPTLVPSDDLAPELTAAVQSIKVTRTRIAGSDDSAWEVERFEIKLHDKLGALDKLMKHLGAYAPQRFEFDMQMVLVVAEALDLTPEEVIEEAQRILVEAKGKVN